MKAADQMRRGWRKNSIRHRGEKMILHEIVLSKRMSFLVCKHRHYGVAETANPGSGNRESGNAETAIAVMSYGCRI